MTDITPFVGSQAYSDYYTRLNKVLGAGTVVGQSTTANSTPAYIIPTSPAATPAPVAPTTPLTPAAPAILATPATLAATTAKSSTFPSAALQPGSTDTASVRALQDYLVSQGYMTQEQVNTGYGTYGPQTTAAVAALQKAKGVDNSSGVGYFGPKTIAALQGGAPATPGGAPATPTAPGATPSAPITDPAAERASIAKELGISDTEAAAFAKPAKTSEEMYNSAYATAGLGDLKTRIKTLTDEIDADRRQLADAVGTVNENPFLIEQSRVGRGKRLLDQAEQRIGNKSSQLKALTDLYNQGVSEVSAVVTRNNADFTRDQNLATAKLNYLQTKAEQSYQDWSSGRTEPKLTGSSETGFYRYDPTTKRFVQVIPASESAAFNKLPGSYQEWVLAGKHGTYAAFVEKKSPSNTGVTFNPTTGEKSVVQRFLNSQEGKDSGATPDDIAKAKTDPDFFYFVLQQAINSGYSTQI